MKSLVIYFSHTGENYMSDGIRNIVKPFTTHEGSGLGNVLDDINRFCKGATIDVGLAIRGSSASNSKNIIEEWCK